MKFLVVFGCAMIFLFMIASTVNAGSGRRVMPSLAGYVSWEAQLTTVTIMCPELTALIHSVGQKEQLLHDCM